MIYNINKDNCYKISGSLVLNNRYTRIEGNSYSSGYALRTLGSDYAKPTGDADVLYRWNNWASYKIGSYWTKFAFRYYCKEYSIGELTSSTIMDLNQSSFSTKVTTEQGTKDAFNYTYPNVTYPGVEIEYSPTSGFDLSTTMQNVKPLLGACSVQYNDVSLYSVTPVIKVVYKIELLAGQSSDTDTVPKPESVWGTVEIGDEIQYAVLSTNLYQTSNSFELGDRSSPLETFKLPNNPLFDQDSKRADISLIEDSGYTILDNYKKGKQIVKITCPLLDLVSTTGQISEQHLFEVGQYFYILDDVGNSIFYYKLTNIPKIFELISAEYVQENWNLVLKEVAKVESN